MQDHAESKAEAQEVAVMKLLHARMIDRMGGWGDDGQVLLTPAEARQADELQRRWFGVRLHGALRVPRRARPRGRAAPRRRRSASSSRTSSADPGDDGPGEPPPPRLAVAPPPRATLTYGHLTADQRGLTWTGLCTGCHREGVQVAPSRDHHERVLCEACAARSGLAPLAVPGSVPVVTRVSDSTWEAWERERRQAAKKDRASRPPGLADLAAKLTEAKLGPIIDEELGLVRADCPACQAGDDLWRPYAIVPRHGKVVACCTACGIEEVEHV